MAQPDFLTVAEVAEQSRFSEKTVRRAIRRGELRASKPCAHWRIRLQDFKAWVEGDGRGKARSCPSVAPTPAPPAVGSRAALRRIESESA